MAKQSGKQPPAAIASERRMQRLFASLYHDDAATTVMAMAIITEQADFAVLRFCVCPAKPRQDVLSPGVKLGQSAYKLCWGFRGDFSLTSCSFHLLQLLEHLPAQVCLCKPLSCAACGDTWSRVQVHAGLRVR